MMPLPLRQRTAVCRGRAVTPQQARARVRDPEACRGVAAAAQPLWQPPRCFLFDAFRPGRKTGTPCSSEYPGKC